MNSKLLYILWKSVLSQIIFFVCGMCSRLNEQVALFARVQKSTCANVPYPMFK